MATRFESEPHTEEEIQLIRMRYAFGAELEYCHRSGQHKTWRRLKGEFGGTLSDGVFRHFLFRQPESEDEPA